MERKGKILSVILILAGIVLPSCTYHGFENCRMKAVRICFSAAGLKSKALNPDEEKISDISLMIFNRDGEAEECIYLDDAEDCDVRLLVENKYTICACVNFGYRVCAENLDELENLEYHLAYPDDYSLGIPMYAYQEIYLDGDTEEISLELKRLMAKISLQIDRSRLSEGVGFYIRSAKICNCPRLTKVFGQNSISNSDECFALGFQRSDYETDILNTNNDVSEAISLYMLENMQGEFDGEIENDSDKVFEENDPRRSRCSYIELEIEYISGKYYSSGKGLIYRFYLGEDRSNLDVERNCHYRITVSPEDDGLSDDGWRIDKSNLKERDEEAEGWIKGYPSKYVWGNVGDTLHLWCEFYPEDAEFDIGLEELEFDRGRGIYDYIIDEDGHGVSLILEKSGTGLLYMEAGHPINDAVIFFVEVNLEDS